MNQALSELLQQLRAATRVQDVFGAAHLTSAQALKRRYRALAGQAHPDHHPNDVVAANEAFKRLQDWYEAAKQVAASADPAAPIIAVAGRQHAYRGVEPPIVGDLCDLYPVTADGAPVLLKVARRAHNHDLLQTEAATLAQLARALDGQPLAAHFPTLIEHFLLCGADGHLHHVNVLRQETGCVTLAAVHKAFAGGLPLADAAWMFNRVLAALGVVHGLGLVHGAVTLAHVLVRPADHNGLLLDWCYSAPIGETIKAISPPYAADYAPEVHARQPATPATDLFMAARSLLHLLGGQNDPDDLPVGVPPAMRALLRACLIPSPRRRINDAWELLDDFQDILQRLYGPRTFRPFHMPS
ncbi:DnaJ domain-containing protein [Candidatus Amarolinea aalborgensis]|jgi:serine/threonine protein kinase|uniref:DnaJ domain-containing protein n=1 Tax=Candidatus Amarolinea aalborgensis TaxID=2249329 RepID=UPI003BFA09A1